MGTCSITITYLIHFVFQSRAMSTVTIGPLAIDPFGDVAIDPMEEDQLGTPAPSTVSYMIP